MQKIVARYMSGRTVKGQTANFGPAAARFVVIPASGAGEPISIEMSDLKAVFFVRDFLGDPNRKDDDAFRSDQPYNGRKLEVIFKDGEILHGTCPSYDPEQPGFFIFPADPNSNTIKAFAVASSVKSVRML